MGTFSGGDGLNVGRGSGLVLSRSPMHEVTNTPAAAAADRDMNWRRVRRRGNTVRRAYRRPRRPPGPNPCGSLAPTLPEDRRQQRDRALLVERLVAVAALRATARSSGIRASRGTRGSPRASPRSHRSLRRGAPLGDAGAARVAVVDEDRRARRCRGASASRRRRCPSGRTWPPAAAGRSPRARPRGSRPARRAAPRAARSITAGGIVHHTARVSSSTGGSGSGISSSVSFVRDRACARSSRPGSSRGPIPNAWPTVADARPRSRISPTAMSVMSRACV